MKTKTRVVTGVTGVTGDAYGPIARLRGLGQMHFGSPLLELPVTPVTPVTTNINANANNDLRGYRNGYRSKARVTGTEDYFQRTVWVFLRRSLPETAVAWATSNDSGGRERMHEGARRKAMGRVAGIPDLFVLHNGRLHGIELKRPPKTLASGKVSKAKPVTSDAQDDAMRRLMIAGAPCRVCRSIDEVADFLTQCGVPLKARVMK